MRIELPDGQWAEFRDPSTLTEGQRRPIKRKMLSLPAELRQQLAKVAEMTPQTDAGELDDVRAELLKIESEKLEALFGPDEVAVTEDVADLLVCAVTTAWSLPGECPPTVDQLLTLPTATYDRLQQEASAFMAPMLYGVDFAPNKDEARGTPTTP